MSDREPSPHPPLPSGFPGPADSRARPVRIGVFAKHWTPGATKTRLAASIGAEAAAAASRAFLETVLERLATLDRHAKRCVLAYSPAEQAAAFASLSAVRQGPWECVPQADGTLGDRMRTFFSADAAPTLLVGSDSPDMPLEAITEALDWLSEPGDAARLVLGSARDGGYWLIGSRGEPAPVFDGMPWSESNLLEATLERLRQRGWREGADYRLMTPWYDVDDASDLARLRAGLPDGDQPLGRLGERLETLLGPTPT